MSSSSLETAPDARVATATGVLPWLFSTAVHGGLLVLLALHWIQVEPPQGTSLLGELNTTFVSSAERGDAPSGEAVSLDAPVPAEGYYDDEPAPRVQGTSDAAEIIEGASGGGLETLLDAKPAVDLAGVLPSASTAAIARGTDRDTIGSARSLTTRPQGSNRLRGGVAHTSVFGAVGEGRKFVYVFDRSGSMDGHGGRPLQAAKAELISSLQDLGQTQQFQIIFYNEHPRLFNPTGTVGRLVFGTEQNRYLAQKFVGSITADGATRHEEALVMAIRMSPDVIFFLTDADEPRMTTNELVRVAHMNTGTIINTIEFGYGAQADGDNFLVKLARQNGGMHVYVDLARLHEAARR